MIQVERLPLLYIGIVSCAEVKLRRSCIVSGQLASGFQPSLGIGGSPNSIVLSPDGKLLASSGKGGQHRVVDLWDTATGQHITALTAHRQAVFGVSLRRAAVCTALDFALHSGEEVVMSHTGKVRNGVIVLPPHVHLPEGQAVEVRPVVVPSDTGLVLHETAEALPPVSGLPDDLSVNLDYYVHGHLRKQQPRRNRWIPGDTPAPELTDEQAADHVDKVRAMAADTRNLPADLSTNHDHYLHGLPRR